MDMNTSLMVLSFLVVALITILIYYAAWVQKKMAQLKAVQPKPTATAATISPTMVLGAYERLTLFAERSKIDNLVNRLYNSDYSARDMHQTFLQTLRDEYDHNITQQLYVHPTVWEAITRMKDQNAYIINQMAALMPPNASALDLNKKLLDFTLNNPEATLNKVVLEAIQFEAKKLIG